MQEQLQEHWESRLLALAGRNSRPTAAGLYPWASEIAREKAYAACDQITARYSKSFYLASGLLPKEKRAAIRALYAFCRTVDDIVDESTHTNKTIELDYWRGIVQGARRPRPDDLVGLAWADTRARYHIPDHYALQLIDGVARDLSQTCYATFDDLTTYCYGVASTVGLSSIYIIGFHSDQAIPYAIRLGVALQMTNILRDIAEDFRNGHVYLPQDELGGFGIHEDDLASGTITPQWREFMRFQIERTRGLYGEAQQGIQYLDQDGRLAIGAASDFYQGILDAIEANDYDVFTRRAGLGAWGKLRRIPALWWKWGK